MDQMEKNQKLKKLFGIDYDLNDNLYTYIY